MVLILALSAAALFGIGDFFGGLGTRRAGLIAVLFLSHLMGLAGITVVAVAVGGEVTARDLVAGAAAGAGGGVGVALLYRGLARGVMAVVAPVTGVIAAALPAIVGVILGERPSVRVLGGIILAICAVALMSAGGRGRISASSLLLAGGAGIGFAAFYVALSRASAAAGLWPLAAARSTTVVAFGLVAVGARFRAASVTKLDARGLALIVGTAVGDLGANALYLLAVHAGLLSVVAVLVSLYPASTILCSITLLGERLRPAQVAGVAAALGGVALISAG